MIERARHPARVLVCALGIGSVLFGCATDMTREELAAEYYNLGTAYLDLGEAERAAEYFLRAIDLDREFVEADFNLARAYLEGDRITDAISVLSSLLVEDPRNTMLLRTLGYAYYRAGDDERAREYYESALEENEVDVDALYNLGVIDYEAERYEDALTYLQRAEELDDGEDISRALGLAYFALDRDEAAEERLVGLTAPDDEEIDVEVMWALAELARRATEFGTAVERYQALSDADPDDPRPRYKIAEIRLLHIDEEEAGLADLRSALERNYSDTARLELLLADLEGTRKELVEGIILDAGFAVENGRVTDEE